MKNIPYASALGSLMYAQIGTTPDMTFVVEVLDIYQSNTGVDHRKVVKKGMRCL